MTLYRIYEDTFEIHRPAAYYTDEDIFEEYKRQAACCPTVRAVLQDEDKARAVFNNGFRGQCSTAWHRGHIAPYLYCTVLFLQAEEYDEDVEFDQSGGILAYAAEAWGTQDCIDEEE